MVLLLSPPVAATLQPPLPLVLGNPALLCFGVAAFDAVLVNHVVEEDLDAVVGKLLEAHGLLLVAAASGKDSGLEQRIWRLEMII